MAKPQQPELRRSGKVPALDPDATEAARSADRPTDATPSEELPPDQRPGHHPDDEQDKPDLDAFAERLGTVPPDERTDEKSDGSDDADEDAGERDHPPRQRWRTPVEIAAASLGVAGLLFKMLRRRRS